MAGCKTVVPQNPVDLQKYASGRWYIHQQMATQAGNPNGQWDYWCVLLGRDSCGERKAVVGFNIDRGEK